MFVFLNSFFSFFLKKYKGGSFTKMVYWRPPDPPNLPAFIIKDEFQAQSSFLPLKPDPSLKVDLSNNIFIFSFNLIFIFILYYFCRGWFWCIKVFKISIKLNT